ncbi:MAG: bifunctional phosphoribosylaminoimidazolecarboxamide formyltransferase/IMP cyclohydrolase [Candidatus Stygibacter australis]|nr:bifunctional phosphoribosylaminoimidazolecarboxamide formyltransferase/IMP cyclohydrolase [Candidatus Stygibacter australis]MDP8321304.1 bifunctional phosphoribosylaminoimidazolecarboxamide formyltransferase/IMP cyclohydrolase [Candidatus Stygibacter australis]
MNLIKIKRALVSVSDKADIEYIAGILSKSGCEIISTGGTKRRLSDAGIQVTDISNITGNPEAFDGRMKTISFQVESALLFDREKDAEEAKSLNVKPIDLVICNLYPFAEKVKQGAELPELIENIDIGGPTMIRSAAKNYKWVTVITDPSDYQKLEKELTENDWHISEQFRFQMMRKAFNHTADYDAMIATTLDEKAGEKSIRLFYDHGIELRYGENSHQEAVLYRDNTTENSLADLEYLHGKQLSYNNILDIEAAQLTVRDIPQTAVAIIKHLNPCGFACGDDQKEVLTNAWFGDPVSAFGSIIAFNKKLELSSAEFLELNNPDKSKRKFIEVIAAPDFAEGVIDYLSFHKNLRIIKFDPDSIKSKFNLRFVHGSILWQTSDDKLYDSLNQVTEGDIDWISDQDLIEFGLKAVRSIKSNAIVIVQRSDKGILRLTGMGTGQPNRLIATQLALDKTRTNLRNEAKDAGIEDIEEYVTTQIGKSILVSDAYFPFADNLELAAESGIRNIIQPGGSIRDKKVIKTARALGINMLFTGIRHFRH